MVSNAQKTRTAYIQSIETKRQNIGPVNTSETTICMCTKWESKNNRQYKRREVHIYPKR